LGFDNGGSHRRDRFAKALGADPAQRALLLDESSTIPMKRKRKRNYSRQFLCEMAPRSY